jgi:hypothetical protein
MNPALRQNEPNVDLSRFDRLVQNEPSTRKPSANSELPDGKYEVRIEDVALYTSSRSGNPVLKYTLRVLGPTHVGQLMWKYRGITENTLQYVKDELKLCGLELARFSDLNFHLHDLIGVELEVTRRTRGEEVNIYFNSVMESDGPEDELPF